MSAAVDLDRVARSIAKARGTKFSPIVRRETCSGGCIHQAEILLLADGSRWFMKSNRAAASMLAFEKQGLEYLGAAATLRVPQVLLQEDVGDWSVLILECIERGRPGATFFEEFGHRLAALHRRMSNDRFGWFADGYLGTTPQPGGFDSDWVRFFRDKRLRFQWQLLQRRGIDSTELWRRLDVLSGRLDDYLGEPRDPPSLLHGDLWSGNYLCDADGAPVLIDPAVHYGHREFELAMPLLFGGFPSKFFEAYAESWSLAEGWEDRVEIYQLYHLLNHVNLFGDSYLEACLRILRRFT
ncbi:MAG: fructosamine kinase family protein [Pirellulaceae bacterium]|nr:MAG: fructosamine kinase family protein [Pirellulaceae bacterium]